MASNYFGDSLIQGHLRPAPLPQTIGKSFLTQSLHPAHNRARSGTLEIRGKSVFGDFNPAARQRRPARHVLHNTTILPDLLPIDEAKRREPPHSPRVHHRLDIPGTHRTIAEEMIVMPDTPADQFGVILQSLYPAPGILRLDDLDRHDEVEELKCDRH